jgi:DNA-binding transcriptional MocR family regulator
LIAFEIPKAGCSTSGYLLQNPCPWRAYGWHGTESIIKRLRKFKVEVFERSFLTRLVERFASDGKLDAHIGELNANYRHKRDVMVAAITEHFPADVRYVVPTGGFFIYCYLPADLPAPK